MVRIGLTCVAHCQIINSERLSKIASYSTPGTLPLFRH
jgi:hypothetical protein